MLMKRLLRDGGHTYRQIYNHYQHYKDRYSYPDLAAELGNVLFVNLPTWVPRWVFLKVRNEPEVHRRAIELAFNYDLKVVVEEEIIGREIECLFWVMNYQRLLFPGRSFRMPISILTKPRISTMTVPAWRSRARLPCPCLQKVQELAKATFKALNVRGCKGGCFSYSR